MKQGNVYFLFGHGLSGETGMVLVLNGLGVYAWSWPSGTTAFNATFTASQFIYAHIRSHPYKVTEVLLGQKYRVEANKWEDTWPLYCAEWNQSTEVAA